MMDFLTSLFNNFISEITFATIALLFSIGFFHFRRLFKVVQEGRASRAPDSKNTAYEYAGEIFISNKEGMNNLTNSRAIDYGVVWGPNSHWLAFQSANTKDNSRVSIFVADVKSGKVVNVLTCLMSEKFPRPAHWDADGNLHLDLGGSEHIVKQYELEKRLV